MKAQRQSNGSSNDVIATISDKENLSSNNEVSKGQKIKHANRKPDKVLSLSHENKISPILKNDPDYDGPKRAQWGNGLEFLMSCISLSVGLGNIWRFPFTA